MALGKLDTKRKQDMDEIYDKPAPAAEEVPSAADNEVGGQAEQVRISVEQLINEIGSANDALSLMAAVSQAEKSGRLPTAVVFEHGQERAVRLGEKETAIMYGNRVSAELMRNSVENLHRAVAGMSDSASQHMVAAQTMRTSADLIHRAAHHS